jgi:hypothetical protein
MKCIRWFVLFNLKDPEAEEVVCDEQGNFQCDTTKHFTIVCEQDIDNEEDPNFTGTECLAHIARVDERRRSFILQNWTPKHSWLYSEEPDIFRITPYSV